MNRQAQTVTVKAGTTAYSFGMGRGVATVTVECNTRLPVVSVRGDLWRVRINGQSYQVGAADLETEQGR